MSEILKLNVGGMRYETSLKTLTTVEPENTLARMVQQEREMEQIWNCEELFIDRNGTVFEHILEVRYCIFGNSATNSRTLPRSRGKIAVNAHQQQ